MNPILAGCLAGGLIAARGNESCLVQGMYIICIADSSLVCFPRRMQVDRKHRLSAAWASQRSRARSSTTPSICNRVSVDVSISHPVNRGAPRSSHPHHRARADRLCTPAQESPSTAQVAAFSGRSFSGQRASALTSTSSAFNRCPPADSKPPAYHCARPSSCVSFAGVNHQVGWRRRL